MQFRPYFLSFQFIYFAIYLRVLWYVVADRRKVLKRDQRSKKEKRAKIIDRIREEVGTEVFNSEK